MTEEQSKAEVEVGSYTPDGTFLGEKLRFAGEEVGFWREYIGGDTRGTDYTLYQTPEGYRVYEEHWSRWQGEGGMSHLHPAGENEYGDPTTEAREEPYTEQEARQAWPSLFAALGMPNVRDID